MPEKSPCRLFVILARDADVGVILRRGPSQWFQVIKWDTRRDTFDDGAWFHGRIYEESCDVSPDGELFVYFAAKHNRATRDDDYGYAWTVLSRPPWLYALGLWPSPTGTYPGGGRFSENGHLTLLRYYEELVPHLNHLPPRQLIIEQQNWRDWQQDKGLKEVIKGADWSGREQRGNIVYSRCGKLFRRASTNGEFEDREIANFNGRFPLPEPAPEWARHYYRRHKWNARKRKKKSNGAKSK
jgi:hypothetical protein